MAKRKRTKGQKTIYKTYFCIYKTKDRVTRTSLITGGELRCSRRISSFCSTSGTRPSCYSSYKPDDSSWASRMTLHCFQVEHIRCYLWHRYSVTGNQVMVTTIKISKWWRGDKLMIIPSVVMLVSFLSRGLCPFCVSNLLTSRFK